MKRVLFYLFSILIMGILVITCRDEQIPTVNSENISSFLMKSSESGSYIVRYEMEGAYIAFDANAGFILSLGINDFSSLCSGGPGLELFDVKELYLPNSDPDLRRMILKIKSDDITAMIWRSKYWPDDICNFATNNEPLAVGTVKYTQNDNDYYGWEQDNNNHNVFGWKANGTLTGSDGQLYKLNFVNRGVWDGDDPDTFKQVLKIQLTPTGKK